MDSVFQDLRAKEIIVGGTNNKINLRQVNASNSSSITIENSSSGNGILNVRNSSATVVAQIHGEVGNAVFGGTGVVTGAMLAVTSTTRGFLPPRMTETQRDAIATPPAGLMVYNTTTNKLNVYTGSAWEAITST